jgi:LPS O-antigen subunit length determinant protein (WzzB/FepE family)
MTRGRNTRIFVEGRLAEVKTDLVAAEESLKVYQQRHGFEVLGQEAAQAVELYANLKALALAKEVELDVMRSYTTADNPLYHSTQRELSELNARLSQMPPLAMEYARRLRDLKIQEELYALLTQQYEQAKILEARDTPTVVILEEAKPPSIPSWPKKGLFVGLFTVLGLVVGILIAAGEQFIENLKQRPDEYENLRRISEGIKRDLRFWSRRKGQG